MHIIYYYVHHSLLKCWDEIQVQISNIWFLPTMPSVPLEGGLIGWMSGASAQAFCRSFWISVFWGSIEIQIIYLFFQNIAHLLALLLCWGQLNTNLDFNCSKYWLNYIYIFLKFCKYVSFRAMNVTARFQHIDVFWKGWSEFVMTLVLGSNWQTMHTDKNQLWKTLKS